MKCFDDDCYTLFEIFVGNNVHVDEVRQSVILMAAMYACWNQYLILILAILTCM